MISRYFLLAVCLAGVLLPGANASCFHAMLDDFAVPPHGGGILFSLGPVEKPHSPCSTFKIPLALMGYEEGILINPDEPCMEFVPEYMESFSPSWQLESWKRDQTPKSWMANSCVWYSQLITETMHMELFQDYVSRFAYGNQKLTDDNSLTHGWLNNTLEISAKEQVRFIRNMLMRHLDVSDESIAFAKVLLTQDAIQGWNHYGKTGSGRLANGKPMGWYVGWLEKQNHVITFAHYYEGYSKAEQNVSKTAKEAMIKKLGQAVLNSGL